MIMMMMLLLLLFVIGFASTTPLVMILGNHDESQLLIDLILESEKTDKTNAGACYVKASLISRAYEHAGAATSMTAALRHLWSSPAAITRIADDGDDIVQCEFNRSLEVSSQLPPTTRVEYRRALAFVRALAAAKTNQSTVCSYVVFQDKHMAWRLPLLMLLASKGALNDFKVVLVTRRTARTWLADADEGDTFSPLFAASHAPPKLLDRLNRLRNQFFDIESHRGIISSTLLAINQSSSSAAAAAYRRMSAAALARRFQTQSILSSWYAYSLQYFFALLQQFSVHAKMHIVRFEDLHNGSMASATTSHLFAFLRNQPIALHAPNYHLLHHIRQKTHEIYKNSAPLEALEAPALAAIERATAAVALSQVGGYSLEKTRISSSIAVESILSMLTSNVATCAALVTADFARYTVATSESPSLSLPVLIHYNVMSDLKYQGEFIEIKQRNDVPRLLMARVKAVVANFSAAGDNDVAEFTLIQVKAGQLHVLLPERSSGDEVKNSIYCTFDHLSRLLLEHESLGYRIASSQLLLTHSSSLTSILRGIASHKPKYLAVYNNTRHGLLKFVVLAPRIVNDYNDVDHIIAAAAARDLLLIDFFPGSEFSCPSTTSMIKSWPQSDTSFDLSLNDYSNLSNEKNTTTPPVVVVFVPFSNTSPYNHSQVNFFAATVGGANANIAHRLQDLSVADLIVTKETPSTLPPPPLSYLIATPILVVHILKNSINVSSSSRQEYSSITIPSTVSFYTPSYATLLQMSATDNQLLHAIHHSTGIFEVHVLVTNDQVRIRDFVLRLALLIRQHRLRGVFEQRRRLVRRRLHPQALSDRFTSLLLQGTVDDEAKMKLLNETSYVLCEHGCSGGFRFCRRGKAKGQCQPYE